MEDNRMEENSICYVCDEWGKDEDMIFIDTKPYHPDCNPETAFMRKREAIGEYQMEDKRGN